MSESEQSDVSLDEEIGALIDGDDVTEETPEEAEAAEAAEEPQEGAEPTQDEKDAQEAVEEVLEALSPPDRWDSRYKEAFSSIGGEEFDPRAVQEAWLDFHKDRQAYATQVEQERAQFQRQLDEFNEVVAPYQQTWDMAGLTPAQGVRQLMGWAGALQKDPHGTIERLAQSVGLDLGAYAQQKAQEAEWQDPQVKQLADNYAQLSGQFRTLQEETVRSKLEANQAAIDQQLTAFRDAADEHGNPLHPHFDRVSDAMAQIHMGAIQTGQQPPTLDQSYEMAVWADPELRSEMLKAQAEKDSARNAGAAQKAATASRSVKSKGAGSDTSPPKSIDEEVSDLIEAQLAG